jgi:hypothetical protein
MNRESTTVARPADRRRAGAAGRASDGLTVLLTERNANLTAHAGQISFGRQPRKPTTPTGLPRHCARPRRNRAGSRLHRGAGSLPDYITGTGFHVSRGRAGASVCLQPDAGEVADVFEVPLAFLMDRRHERRMFRWEGRAPVLCAMPYPREDGGHRFIWGATAACYAISITCSRLRPRRRSRRPRRCLRPRRVVAVTRHLVGGSSCRPYFGSAAPRASPLRGGALHRSGGFQVGIQRGSVVEHEAVAA